MFTGIIEAAGKIDSIEHGPDGGRLRVSLANAPAVAEGMKLGDSISVNGCCLTVVEFAADHFSADLSGETLRRTSLGERKPGDPVNLERPLAAGGRLGGHFVQGHVDGIGHVTRLAPEGAEGSSWWLSVSIPDDLRRYVAEKGSIAIDGISLTVARWQNQSAVASAKADGIADFAVIPFTYEQTNVHAMAIGNAVNLEVDILAKYVESLVASRGTPTPSAAPKSRLTISKLIEEGF
jgi:riboflavin synthase